MATWLLTSLMYSRLASGLFTIRKGIGFLGRLLKVVGKGSLFRYGLATVCWYIYKDTRHSPVLTCVIHMVNNNTHLLGCLGGSVG